MKTNVLFLASENGFSLIIFCLLMSAKTNYSLANIKHLVCRKMCSTTFGNRITDKKSQKNLNGDFVWSREIIHDLKV